MAITCETRWHLSVEAKQRQVPSVPPHDSTQNCHLSTLTILSLQIQMRFVCKSWHRPAKTQCKWSEPLQSKNRNLDHQPIQFIHYTDYFCSLKTSTVRVLRCACSLDNRKASPLSSQSKAIYTLHSYLHTLNFLHTLHICSNPNECDPCEYASTLANHLTTHMFKIKRKICSTRRQSKDIFVSAHFVPYCPPIALLSAPAKGQRTA